eukprot:tig00000383_g24698.t1
MPETPNKKPKMSALPSSLPEWRQLADHAAEIKQTHLRDLLKDVARTTSMNAEFDGIYLDYSRQCATKKTVDLLFKLADATGLKKKIADLASGQKINTTENRAVLHIALRAQAGESIVVDGKDVVPEVHKVLAKIEDFANRVRGGQFVGCTGKPLTDVVSIGIGGSYLGTEFVYEALRHDGEANAAAAGRRLRFLANVDPVDVARATEGLDPETTLVIVCSKTFTTAETMLNARTLRKWLQDGLKGHADAVKKHMVAVSTALDLVDKFGIDTANAFGFWDWVGGRYSVCSAVGALPLSLQYGPGVFRRFLQGAHAVDRHFLAADFRGNLPVLLGLFGVWNATFLGHASRALLPYAQALLRFPAHIQQVDMESNGKRVALDGTALDFEAGEVNFGEPGTNGQHSFYQLMHQGRVLPADFIGAAVSQRPASLPGEPVSNHDELMSNFFAQPDALALGKTAEELRAEGCPEPLIPHRSFPGNRPSNMLLLPRLDAYTTGQLLALFEHRTVVEGFVWGINSFDQYGVELGKVLATQVRKELQQARAAGAGAALSRSYNPSTDALLLRYLKHSGAKL